MITKEEFIERTDKVIHQMENAIEDIKNEQKHFVDFDETMDEVGPLDNLENGAQLIGVCQWDKPSRRFDLLFHVKHDLYTKTFVKK